MIVKQDFDVIVLGGGAAGLMCAIEAGKRGRRVVVLERASRIGKKILISGGGRCNFTNLYCQPENFISSNPHFAKSALAAYTPADFVRLVEKHRIAHHEKTLGQLFCDGSAQQIVNMLEAECRSAAVRILTGVNVENVERGDGFVVRAGQEFRAPALVVATGGLSIPKMGATPFGYDMAKQFGIRINATRPALTPLLFNDQDRQQYSDLSGVSVEVVIAIGRQSFREKMLFTHRGLSGPAILQISSYWKPAIPITIDLAPGHDFTASLRSNSARRDLNALKTVLREVLPQRLAERWIDLHPPADWTNRSLSEFDRQAHKWIVIPENADGYDKAEVTAGGVDTDELSAKTMESRKIPGLYFIGEVVDVTGHLGGFNFQWAWASGFCAGQAL
jgi:predicted Rossmann fold flavoprotein